MIAETNQAYATGGVHQRLALVGRSEVSYTETSGRVDIFRLGDPDDGHLDEAHALRDRTGADLVHLIVDHPDLSTYGVCGIATLGGEGTKFELGVDAQRRERSLQGGTDHGALARATMRW